MKRSFYLLGMLLSGGVALAQQDAEGRVGINTDSPQATLDIAELSNVPSTQPQGVSFPNFSTEERAKFENPKVGTMIFNTTKKCLEMYFGLKGGRPHWDCIPNATSAQSQNVAIVPAGFEGTYIAGIAMNSANKVKFELQNNGFVGITNVNFSDAVSLVGLAKQGNVSVKQGQHTSVSLNGGESRVLTYQLEGTPEAGTLVAKFEKLGLSADQQTVVDLGLGLGSASVANKDNYTVSLYYHQPTNTTIQGKINNGAEKVTIKIPYTGGKGSYNAVNINNIKTAAGQNGDVNNLSLSIPAGNFGEQGELTATISVDGDGEYLVKQMAPGEQYTIATFPIDMNGTRYDVVLKGIGGIPDRCFGKTTLECVGYGANVKEHEFIYVPIEGPDGRTWLNNNLGAEYARVGSQYFNPVQQATSKTDWKAYGSLFQWQRNPDGHELINWSGSTSGTPKYTGTGSLSNSWTNAGTNKFIPSSGSTWSWNSGQGPWDLWQSGKSNNPCPQGYHVPTKEEWQTLHQAIAGSTSSVSNNKMWSETSLSLPASGNRYYNASFYNQGSYGNYWSSSQSYSKFARSMLFLSGTSNPSYDTGQATGFSVRCLKD
ncbi:FISUMP domain-containing protein [Ornithobacterium rhinotracheale]|uniref:FISUMP domain-containing protein n=1 Tax=Ornithobacterium rhinotracheale TaxID=28251 RepID=UPI00403A0719